MKARNVALLVILSSGCDASSGGKTPSQDRTPPSDPVSTAGNDSASDVAGDGAFLRSLGISEEEASLELPSLSPLSSTNNGRDATHANGLTGFEVKLPHTTQAPNPPVEKALLGAYLDTPSDLRLVKLLAVYHLPQSLLNPRRLGSSNEGDALQHTILSSYFLNRAKDLGAMSPWVDLALQFTQAELDRLVENGDPITSEEYHDAHVYYRQVFHGNQEQNRYQALIRLLQDFVLEPRDVYTSFALMTFNLWIGSEADYDDPTMLNNFVLGSYFQMRVFDLSQKLEQAWNQDPEHNTRFRMAAELGSFGLLERRWLAKAHGDQNAVRLIDDEHRAWWRIQPAIHSFTLGLPFFDEPEHFAEGLDVYYSAYPYCAAVPVRTCSNLPRFPFNLLSFVLGLVDFRLKAGDMDTARYLLGYRFDPVEAENWTQWTLGRESWLHREQNLDAIFALYQNDDPSDDPINFETKRHKWGETTAVCQVCHETQGKPQTQAQLEAPQTLPPPQAASVGKWPPVTTAWYGATLR